MKFFNIPISFGISDKRLRPKYNDSNVFILHNSGIRALNVYAMVNFAK